MHSTDFALPAANTMGSQPRFTIVVPAYNEADFIGNCLDSLLQQDWAAPVEILVIDNNSTDRTAEVARSRGVTVIHEPRAGVCPARQRGTELARGEIVVSTDADTVFAPGWLTRIDAAFREDPDRVAVAGPCQFMDPPWWARTYTWVLFHVVSTVARLTGRILYATATNIAFRKSAWSGYDTEASQGGDELGLLRSLRTRGPVAFDLGNPTFTSSRRLDRGLVYNVFVTCFYYYLAGYAVNRLAGRMVIGMAPAFRVRSAARAPIRTMMQRLASVSVGLAFCLVFGDLALRLAEEMW